MSSRTYELPNFSEASLAVAAKPSSAVEQARALATLWSLVTTLQTTLDLSALLQLIHQQVFQLVAHDGCMYRDQERSFEERTGRTRGHSCSLSLVLDGDSVGEISFFRRERFTQNELTVLEGLCSLLHFPLRNAVSFRHAQRGCRRDSLTGLGNRTALEEGLCRELELFQRTGQPFALLILDIDHFKQVNDRHGHLMGDQVLVTVANTIARNLRRSDLLYRYGGEEFVALLPGGHDFEPCHVAERVRRRVEALPASSVAEIPGVTLSSGCAVVRRGDCSESLLERADRALYKAKHAGRNRVESAA
jgi:diguanylate cyclase (GGDEF)-like protein